jgi:hypothetical protein
LYLLYHYYTPTGDDRETRRGTMSERIKGVIRLSDLHAREMRWLWAPYIPYGSTSIIFAPGGHGKSFLTAALATARSNGDLLPGQTEESEPGKVLMLSAEDDAEVVLVPRLQSMGADLERIFIPSKPFELSESGLKALEKLILDTGATFVVIDPMVHYIGSKIDMNKMNEVRGVVGKLQQMAMKYPDTAITLVHHSRKSRDGDRGDNAFEKAAGSSDFVNAVRSAMLIERSNDGGNNYLLRHVKSNYSALGKSIGFKFGGEKLFEWGDFYSVDGRRMLTRQRTSQKREIAWAFVVKYLAQGPQIGADLVDLAAKEGIARKNVYRAVEGRVVSQYIKTKDGKVRVKWTIKPEYMPKDTPAPVETKADRVKKALARLNAEAEG